MHLSLVVPRIIPTSCPPTPDILITGEGLPGGLWQGAQAGWCPGVF